MISRILRIFRRHRPDYDMELLHTYECTFDRMLELADGDIDRVPKPRLFEGIADIDPSLHLEEYDDPYEWANLNTVIVLSIRNEKLIKGTGPI